MQSGSKFKAKHDPYGKLSVSRHTTASKRSCNALEKALEMRERWRGKKACQER